MATALRRGASASLVRLTSVRWLCASWRGLRRTSARADRLPRSPSGIALAGRGNGHGILAGVHQGAPRPPPKSASASATATAAPAAANFSLQLGTRVAQYRRAASGGGRPLSPPASRPAAAPPPPRPSASAAATAASTTARGGSAAGATTPAAGSAAGRRRASHSACPTSRDSPRRLPRARSIGGPACRTYRPPYLHRSRPS